MIDRDAPRERRTGDPTLREWVDLITRHERELRESNEKSSGLALQLQAVENARRFEALNGEQARIDKVLNQSVPREVFEARITPIEKQGNRWSGVIAATVGAVIVTAAIVGIISRLM